MGTISKQGFNSRCTVRGPVADDTIGEAVVILREGKRYHTRAARRQARATVRKATKQARHIPDADRSQNQRQAIVLNSIYA